jgi:Mrp family chromosome partitioning ATPase
MIVSKAVEMAHKMNVPILGIIENMAYMEHNGERLYPFGQPKSENLAASYDIPLLAQLPIDPKLVKCADEGEIESYDSEDFHWLVETLLGE